MGRRGSRDTEDRRGREMVGGTYVCTSSRSERARCADTHRWEESSDSISALVGCRDLRTQCGSDLATQKDHGEHVTHVQHTA